TLEAKAKTNNSKTLYAEILNQEPPYYPKLIFCSNKSSKIHFMQKYEVKQYISNKYVVLIPCLISEIMKLYTSDFAPIICCLNTTSA
ncbi:MAG: hypothetical protein MHPSP_004903, partial [Paramarteilia canceri]